MVVMSTPAEAAAGAGQELRRRPARQAGATDGETDTDAAYMRMHAAAIDDALWRLGAVEPWESVEARWQPE